MAVHWRETLREKIQQIIASGGPRAEGVSIVIPARLSEAEFSQFLGMVDRVNDQHFEGAPAETLEILAPARLEGGGFSLGFRFRPGLRGKFNASKPRLDDLEAKERVFEKSQSINFDALFAGRIFPTDKKVLNDIKEGRRHQSIVPVSEGTSLEAGDSVIFLEARIDPFGVPFYDQSGEALSIRLNKAKDDGQLWGSYKLYSIEWDPKQVKSQRGKETITSA